jgi:serine/threonine-protein kinase
VRPANVHRIVNFPDNYWPNAFLVAELPPPADTEAMTDSENLAADLDLTGRKLGDYRLLRKLGRGGMGEVYLAEQESLRRQVALKILHPNLATDGNYVRRFTHEARAAAKLTHANIVQIYEVGQAEGIHYIAQEYVPGQNLRQLLSRRGPLEIGAVIGVLRQVAAALHKASEQGIVHRDIKPENILLTPEGEVKVADFGLARVTTDADLNLTQLGMTMGSPLYMSPEQAEGRPADPRSDLYSFGATCYHMLSGRPPFTADSPLAIAVHHVKTEPAPLADLRPDVPAGLAGIVHRLLSKQPRERFQSAADVLVALRALRGEVSDELLDGLDGWSTPELVALTDARLASTRRLGDLMATQAMVTRRRPAWWLVPAMILCGLFVGVLLASAMKPKPLLEGSQSPVPEVPRMETVAGQLLYAEMQKSEGAWKAVPDYFPPGRSPENRLAAYKAEKGLADFYLLEGRLNDAMILYQELTNVDPAESQIRAQGHAGLLQIYYLTSQDELAMDQLPHVEDYFLMLDKETQTAVEEIRRKLRPGEDQ